MNLAKLLVRAGSVAPSHDALVCGTGAAMPWGVLNARVAALSGALRERFGCASGDRVALFAHNVPEYVEALFACWHAGLVAVPVNAKLHARELAYVIEHSGAALLLVTADLAAIASAAVAAIDRRTHVVEIGSPEWRHALQAAHGTLVPRDDADAAWLFYTSGTTGRPKGATLTHGNLLTMATAYCTDVDAIAPGDAILHAAPMSHGSGLYVVPHVAAMAKQIVPESEGFDPAEVLALCAHHRGVTTFAAPTMVRRLVDAAEGAGDVAGLKTIVYGGGPMYVADAKRALAAFGPRLAQIYGQGESPMTITVLPKRAHADTSHPRFDERLASVGYAQSPVDVIVAGSDGRELPAGERGEILVRGATVMAGYWNDPEATASTLSGGWLHTGDVGSFDADGFLTLNDRSKDLIISGGSNIYPREIEETLLQNAAVREVAVIGRPDPEWGEVVVAYVVSADGATVGSAELDSLCLARIARFKRPKTYRFVDALPKNAYGKVLKTELRDLEAQR